MVLDLDVLFLIFLCIGILIYIILNNRYVERKRILDNKNQQQNLSDNLNRQMSKILAIKNVRPILYSFAQEAIKFDSYIQVGPGVKDRRVKDKNDIKFDFEEPCRSIIQPIDFDQWMVIIVVFDADKKFQGKITDVEEMHFHDQDEEIILIHGSFLNDSTDTIYNGGDICFIHAYEPHSFNPIEGGIGVLKLRKPR